MSKIRLNQMGYTQKAMKNFIYIGNEQVFKVLRLQVVENQELEVLVYEGSLSKVMSDQASGDVVSKGEFSSISEIGNYVIEIGEERSNPFTINCDSLKTSVDALLKAFYYQRCGVTLDEKYASPWHHQSCHQQKAYLYDESAPMQMGDVIETTGGWHDAGDYGRYTVAAAKAIADLLLAYKYYPETFAHSIQIPESQLAHDDILHEVKVELDWMLKMQRQSDGAVYTKVATRVFPGMIMPEDDTEPLLIFDVSSPATADFAAALALAAEVYQEFDETYAMTLKLAAIKAYQWLEANPEPKLFTNPPHVVSGEYGDNADIDERYWAAAQLYDLTGEEKYHDDFVRLHKHLQAKFELGWADVSGYGTWAYIKSQRPKNVEIQETLVKEWLDFAEVLEKRSLHDGYGITLSVDDYIWGSTMILLDQTIHLIVTNELLGHSKYDALIWRNWHYLFGMNPVDISYVTGLGDKSIVAPHHRPSEADGVEAPVPGLVSGGPCAGLYDEAAKTHCQGQPPAKCFIDHVDSYSTNEITIYWNSPAVFVGAYLQSIQE